MSIERTTVEGIPIRKVYVRKGRESYKGLPILEYLSQFGEVEKMEMIPEYETNESVIMFTFSKAEHACRALIREAKSISPFVIMPGFSWYQPTDSTEYSNYPSEENKTTLNEDCLEKIFKYLDIFTLLDVENICRKFNNVTNMCYKSFYPRVTQFNLITYLRQQNIEKISLYKFRLLLLKFGRHIRTIVLNSNCFERETDDLYLVWGSLFNKYCPNLMQVTIHDYYHLNIIGNNSRIDFVDEIIKLVDGDIHNDWLKERPLQYALRFNFNEAIHVDLEECLLYYKGLRYVDLSGGISEPHYFSNFLHNNKKSLQTLMIANFKTILPRHIKKIGKLPRLFEVGINSGYPNVAPKRLSNIIAKRGLRVLYVEYDKSLGDHDINFLLKRINPYYLRFLNLFDCPLGNKSLELILKRDTDLYLGLHNFKEDITNILSKLQHYDHLNGLNLVNCSEVTDEIALEFIDKCRSCERICLAGCKKITNKFIESLREELVRRTNSDKLIIDVYDTSVSEVVLPEDVEMMVFVTMEAERSILLSIRKSTWRDNT